MASYGHTCSPTDTSVHVVDPAPPVTSSSTYSGLGKGGKLRTKPLCNSSDNSSDLAQAVPREVLQIVHLQFQVFVKSRQEKWLIYRLDLSSRDHFGPHTFDVLIVETAKSPVGGQLEWLMRPFPKRCPVIRSMDGGPNFSEPVVLEVMTCSASLENDGFACDPEKLQKVCIPEEIPEGRIECTILTPESEHIMFQITLSVQRRLSGREWNSFCCARAPAPLSALLESAERTGDVILLGEDGVEAAAHSAALVAVPYFEAKLREEWSGSTAWNLHNKLRLRLPCHVSKEALDLFLLCVYGDLRSLYAVDPTNLLLQEILSLANACNMSSLCSDITRLVEVTSTNVSPWLEWLLKEHGAVAELIQEQVVLVMQDQLKNALQRQKFTVMQLAGVSRLLSESE